MKKIIPFIIFVQLCLMAVFLYFEVINFIPRRADIAKYGVIVTAFLTSVLLFRASWSRRDAALLVSGMAVTVVLDYFLVLVKPSDSAFTIGMILYCVVHTLYFFRFNSFKKAFIPPLFVIIPVILLFFNMPVLICVCAFYAQILVADIYSAVVALKKGFIPKINGILILCALVIFVFGDIAVILTNAALIRIFRKIIWVFYAPSQTLLSISSVAYSTKKNNESRF